MYYVYGLIGTLIINLIVFFVIIRKKNQIISILRNEVCKKKESLEEQKTLYTDIITEAKDTDTLSKLKKMKKPHYRALQHINPIIRKNFYKVLYHISNQD